MIHPSYQELMERVNEINETMDTDDAPIISSRYSLVLAASKRARQLTDGAEPKVNLKADKMLSVAVEELYDGEVNILSAPLGQDQDASADSAEAGAAAEEFEDLIGEEPEDGGEDLEFSGLEDGQEE